MMYVSINNRQMDIDKLHAAMNLWRGVLMSRDN